MANMISSFFTAKSFKDKKKREGLIEFLKMAESNGTRGHLPIETTEDSPNGYQVTDSWLFDVVHHPDSPEQDEGEDVVFSFESRWACPIKTLVEIAKQLEFDFEVEYDQADQDTIGACRFTLSSGLLEEREVDASDDADETDDRLNKCNWTKVIE